MNKRKTGQEQEAKAACFLKTQGYQILEQNYRCKRGEIDLVAREGQYLVFCGGKIQIDKRKRSAGRSRRPAKTASDLPRGRMVSDRKKTGYLYAVQI